jgi:hypothetical protein
MSSFEHPGFGGSDTPSWLDNIGDLAYFYLDLLDHFGLQGVHLAGCRSARGSPARSQFVTTARFRA